jgi:hypothetical protein
MPARIDPEDRFRHSEEVASRKIADEVLLVPIRTSAQQKLGVYTLNETASWLWEMMDGSVTCAQLTDAMTERFKVGFERAKKDVEVLCQDLLSFGAIVAA